SGNDPIIGRCGPHANCRIPRHRARGAASLVEQARRVRYASAGTRPRSRTQAAVGGNVMAAALTRVKIAPKGMGLNDFVAMQEGFFAAEGLDVEFDWKTFRGTQSSWKGLDYFQRPQDQPYTQAKEDVIQGACVWGTICNASAGMGKVVADAYGDSP